MRHAFGRFQAADERDFQIKAGHSARRRRTWRCSQVLDQGSMPACVGYAWSGWLMSDPFRQWLNPVGIYRAAQYVDEWEGEDYDGTSVRAGAKVLRNFEFIGEFAATTDVEILAETVLEKGPVVVGTNWYRKMDTPDDAGLIVPKGRIAGGHAYLVIGVDLIAGLLKLLNSWGSDWGLNGRAVIAMSDMQRLLDEDGECWIGREAKPTWRVST